MTEQQAPYRAGANWKTIDVTFTDDYRTGHTTITITEVRLRNGEVVPVDYTVQVPRDERWNPEAAVEEALKRAGEKVA